MNLPLVPLSDVTTVIAGQSPPGDTYNDNGIGLPFFQGKADFGEIHPIARKWCTVPKKTAKRGDILISVRAPVGPTNVADSHCCIGRGLAAIRPDETVVLRDFVLWNLKHRETELVAMGQGSTFSAISQKNLKSLQIPLPPLNEQRRIVNILNRAAKIERLRKQAQERLQEFIPALFIKMFGDPVENPMGWACSPLGEVCSIVGGGTPSRKIRPYWNGDIPWATVKDFRSHRISHTTELISRQGLDHSASKVVPSGTILLVTRVGLGKVAMAGVDLAINQDIKAITPCDDVLPEFLLWYLKHLSPEIERKGTGATVKGVTLKDIKDMPIPIPPLNVQHRFTSLTVRANSNLTTATTAQNTANALSTSLMSHLLESAL